MSTKPRYYDQVGNTKVNYSVNQNATHIQVTVGGRASGDVIIRYRPSLSAHPILGNADINDFNDTEFETTTGNIIDLAGLQDGITRHTYVLSGILASAIQVDDTGNAVDSIWVHIREL